MKTALISQPESRVPFDIPARLRRAGVELACRRCETRDDLVAFAGDAELIWLFGANPSLDGEALRRLPRCRALFRSGSGMDALPCTEARHLGVRLFNTPDSISDAVAEHTVALLLALVRQVVSFDRQVRAGEWDSSARQTRWRLAGRTLGLVGYGRIARAVERMVAGFALHVIHHDPGAPASMPLETLLAHADFVSLHCPLTDETRHLLDRRRLGLMKPEALLVNTARGGLVDEEALADAMENGRLGGAALDVLEREPPAPGLRLLERPNVVVTPHVGAFSVDFEQDFFEASYRKILEIRDLLKEARREEAEIVHAR